MYSLKLVPLILLFISSSLFGQSITLRKITTLPSLVQETSGIETSDPYYIWTHNDGGGAPALYKIDTFGNILKTLTIKNAANSDWEDITSDGNHTYIGDFGNNDNTRKDLKIYKITNPDLLKGDTATAEIIRFYYPNQTGFPPDDAHKNFDAEALIYFENSLYMFSKNYTVPFSGYTYLYKIPAEPGNYAAILIDSFKTGIGYKEQWWITAADISPDGKKLALLSSDKMFVFSGFTGDDFFNGKVKTIDLGSFTQKEAIAFITNDEFYITDEYFSILGGRNLYLGNIKDIFSIGFTDTNKARNNLVIYKKQFGEHSISLIDETKKASATLIDMNGKIVEKYLLDYTQPIVIMDAAAGYYILSITDGYVKQELKIIID